MNSLPGGQSYYPVSPEQGVSGSSDIIDLLRRRLKLITLIIVLGGLAGLLIAFALPDRHKLSATVVLDSQNTRVSETATALERVEFNRSNVETELGVFRSRDFLGDIVDDLKLVEDPGFNPYIPDTVTAPLPIIRWVRQAVNAVFDSGRSKTPPAFEIQRDATITVLETRIRAARIGESLAFKVSLTDADPAKAARMLNTLVDKYVQLSLVRKKSDVNRAIDYLRQRATDLGRKLSEAEALLVDHVRKYQLNNKSIDDQLLTRVSQLKERLNLATNPSVDTTSPADPDQIAQLRGRLAKLQEQSVERSGAKVLHSQLKREVQIDGNRHEQVVSRLAALDSQIDILKPSARVVSRAAISTGTSFPNRKLIVIGSIASAMVLSIMLALFLESLDTRIHSAEEAASISRLTNLGSIPTIPTRILRQQTSLSHYLIENPYSHLMESLRSAYLLARRSTTPEAQVIMVTSGWTNEGKSTLSVGLAVAAVATGHRTVIVDLDLRGCGTTEILNCKDTENHAASYLAGDSELEDIVITTGIKDLHTVSASPIPFPPTKLLSSQRLPEMIAHLKKKYDTVIIDTPAALIVSDAFVAANLVDAALLVVYRGRTTRKSVSEMLKRLKIYKTPVVGTLLNGDASQIEAQYGYAASLAYGNAYGSAASPTAKV